MFKMMLREMRAMVGTLDAGTLYDDMKVGLFTNDIAITDAMVIGDLDQPTYVGYAGQATEPFGTTFDNAAGDVRLLFEPKLFQPDPSNTAPATIRGWFLYHDLATDLVACAYRFDEPVVLTNHLDALPVSPFITIGQPENPDLN